MRSRIATGSRRRGCRNVGKCVWCDSDDRTGFVNRVSHAVHTHPACFKKKYKLIKSPPRWSCSPPACPLDGDADFFVIMQVAGFKRKEGHRERGSEKSGEGRNGETPPLHMLTLPLVHMHICMQLVYTFLSSHRQRWCIVNLYNFH